MMIELTKNMENCVVTLQVCCGKQCFLSFQKTISKTIRVILVLIVQSYALLIKCLLKKNHILNTLESRIFD